MKEVDYSIGTTIFVKKNAKGEHQGEGYTVEI
jgi:hypothetical protein